MLKYTNVHEKGTVYTTNCYSMWNVLRDVYCLCVNKNKVCNVTISGDYKYKIVQTISRECVMYAMRKS